MTLPTLTFEAAFGVEPGQAHGLLVDVTASPGASTPDSASLEPSTDLEVEWWGAPSSWTDRTHLVVKWDAASNERSWQLILNTLFPANTPVVQFDVSSDGTSGTSTGVTFRIDDTFPLTDELVGGLKVTWRASDGRVQLFTRRPFDTSWTQYKDDAVANVGSLHDGAADLYVGRLSDSDTTVRVVKTIVRDGIGGSALASPNFAAQSPGTTSFDDAQGNTWTLAGDAEIGNAWTDLSTRLGDPGGVEWSYGRQSELDRMEAGVGTATVENTDRALEPDYDGSTYHPNIIPMVRVRLQATHASTTYDVLEAFVEDWLPEWAHPADAWATIALVDGTKLLSQARTSASYSSETSGTRIANLLDAADWPDGKRDLDTGQSTLQAYTASDRNVLNAIKDAAEAEDGVFFIAPDGTATFRDRTRRVLNDVQATFGDGSGELPYRRLQLVYSDALVYNDVAVKPSGLAVQRATDADSMQSYGRRWLNREDTLHTTVLEAGDHADWLLSRYKDPRLRVEAIELEPHLDDDVMTQALARQPGDRITVKRRPPGGGDPISRDVVIEHVEHEIRGLEWLTTWRLSPAVTEIMWLAGTAGFSEAGETTFAGF